MLLTRDTIRKFVAYIAGHFRRAAQFGRMARSAAEIRKLTKRWTELQVYGRGIEAFRMMDRNWQTATEAISASALAGGESAPPGWVGSFALHLIVVAAAMFTWAHRLEITDRSPPFVPVDLVKFAEETNITPAALPAARIDPVIQITPVPADKLDIQMPVPEVPQFDSDAEPATAEEGGSQPAPNAVPIVPSQEQQKPPSDQPVLGATSAPQVPNNAVPVQTAPPNARPADRSIQGVGAQNAMTADVASLLRSQVQACWNWPTNVPRPEQLAVDFDVFLNPDGSLARPPQLAAAMAANAPHDPFLRAAAEATRHAIYACAPYKLPADQYAQWREISPFHFDPGTFVLR